MVDVDGQEVEQASIRLTAKAPRAHRSGVDRVIGDLDGLEIRAGVERVLRLPEVDVPSRWVRVAAAVDGQLREDVRRVVDTRGDALPMPRAATVRRDRDVQLVRGSTREGRGPHERDVQTMRGRGPARVTLLVRLHRSRDVELVVA